MRLDYKGEGVQFENSGYFIGGRGGSGVGVEGGWVIEFAKAHRSSCFE